MIMRGKKMGFEVKKRTRQALNIIAVIAFILWLGSLFGIFVSVRAFASAIG